MRRLGVVQKQKALCFCGDDGTCLWIQISIVTSNIIHMSSLGGCLLMAQDTAQWRWQPACNLVKRLSLGSRLFRNNKGIPWQLRRGLPLKLHWRQWPGFAVPFGASCKNNIKSKPILLDIIYIYMFWFMWSMIRIVHAIWIVWLEATRNQIMLLQSQLGADFGMDHRAAEVGGLGEMLKWEIRER